MSERFSVTECNGSGQCGVVLHVHGCFADSGDCIEVSEHEGVVA